MTKVLLISTYFPPMLGGSCVVYSELCSRLGSDVVVFTGLNRESDKQWDSRQEYPIYRSLSITHTGEWNRNGFFTRFLRGAYIFGWQRSLAALLVLMIARRHQIDVVCIGALSHYWMASILRRWLRVPVIFYTHGEELTKPDPSRTVGSRPIEALCEAEGIITISHFSREKLIDLGVRPERIALIPNGANLGQFSPGPKNIALVQKYNLYGRTVLLTVARLEERKGHATVLQALPAIVKARPDVVYVIVGSGNGLPDLKLEKMAVTLGISNHVVHAGKVPSEYLCDFYRTCDIFVMPNFTLPNGDTEGFGLVFLEAAACKKPVIGGRDGGVPDAVVEGNTGLLVNGNSIAEFTSAALSLLNDPQLAAHLGNNGFKRVQEMDWGAVFLRFSNFCNSVADAGPNNINR